MKYLTSDKEIFEAMKATYKNVRIIAYRNKNNYIVVKADSKRFGKDAVMFEGNTFEQCCEYIRELFRTNHFQLTSYSVVPMYTDRTGKTLPWIMDVVF